ncbi:MAG: RidA family protein [Planctomycetota bacterium]|nr:RidA family protein [Planctomycetota bacterium]
MTVSQAFVSSRGPEPVGPYPHARRVGNLLFISGIGPRKRGEKGIPGVTTDAQGNVTSYDIEAQCRAVFENIRVILEDAGCRWENIVDVTSFLTDMKRDFAAYNRVYDEYLGAVRPTRTTVEVRALPTAINVELKVIAVVD